jgi:hypothetical protein
MMAPNCKPLWQLAFHYDIPKGLRHEDTELHLRFFSDQWWARHKLLGEIRLNLTALTGKWNIAQDYTFDIAKIWKTGGLHVRHIQASVKVMLGDRVAADLLEELEKAKRLERKGFTGVLLKVTHKLGQWYRDKFRTPYGYAQNLKTMKAMLENLPVDTEHDDGSDASWNQFNNRTTIQTSSTHQLNTYVWNGPEIEHHKIYTGHIEGAEYLRTLGQRCGNKTAFKPNYLGFIPMNTKFWPNESFHGIGLSQPLDIHAWTRPILAKLAGPGSKMWSSQWIAQEARKFLAGNNAFTVPTDIRGWLAQVLHKVHFNLTLTEDEGKDFMVAQGEIVGMCAIPEKLLKPDTLFGRLIGKAVQKKFDLPGKLKFKEKWIGRYIPALRKLLPDETHGRSDSAMYVLASGMLDALMFAGSQSVPLVISHGLLLPYSAWGQKFLPDEMKDLHNIQKLPAYTWEVIRRFPPVKGFPVQEPSFGNEPDQHVYVSVHMASQDERVWKEPTKFKLRPLEEYHRKSIAFADYANDPDLGSPNSHSCPGKDLAYSIALNFYKEFVRTANNVTGGHTELWYPTLEGDMSRNRLKPEKIELHLLGTTPVTFVKHVDMLGPKRKQASTEAIHMDGLSEEDLRKAFEKLGDKDNIKNKVWQINWQDKMTAYGVMKFLGPEVGADQSSFVVGPPHREKCRSQKRDKKEDCIDLAKDLDEAGIGGLTFLNKKHDEDRAAGWLAQMLSLLTMKAMSIKGKDLDELESNLLWFDNEAEQQASMDSIWGQGLPVQFNTWEDMASDAGMRSLATAGLATWYLKPVSKKPGIVVPDGAVFECDLSYMGKYETRKAWMTYGHVMYLGAPKEEDAEKGKNLPGDVVGIYSVDGAKTVLPTNDNSTEEEKSLWNHVKAGFRSSLVTSVTLKDHLANCHWIKSNGLTQAAMINLSPDHPLRRLLKQFYFGAVTINHDSKDSLLPVGFFGYRSFGFSEKGWLEYFTDIFADMKLETFPQKMKNSGLPSEMTAKLPMYRDGMLFWNVVHKYVDTYLRIFFDEDSISEDKEIRDFYDFFGEDKFFDKSWELEPLSFPNLLNLVTELIWWVTGGHEFIGSIVEYLTGSGGLAFKIQKGKDVADVMTYTQVLNLISMTGMREPQLMDDWAHLFDVEAWKHEKGRTAKTKKQEVLNAVKQFQIDFAACGENINNENIRRAQRGEKTFIAFDPRIMETAVSI